MACGSCAGTGEPGSSMSLLGEPLPVVQPPRFRFLLPQATRCAPAGGATGAGPPPADARQRQRAVADACARAVRVPVSRLAVLASLRLALVLLLQPLVELRGSAGSLIHRTAAAAAPRSSRCRPARAVAAARGARCTACVSPADALLLTPQPNHQPTNRRWPHCSAAHYGDDWPLLFRSRAALPNELVRAADRCHALTLRASNGVVRLNSAAIRGVTGAAASPGSSAGGSSSGSSGGVTTTGVTTTATTTSSSAARGHPGSPSKANVYGFSSVPYCNMAGMVFEEVMQSAFTFGLAMAGGCRGGSGNRSGKVSAAAAGAELVRFKGDIAWWLTCRPEVR
jgi:hypothetical protein